MNLSTFHPGDYIRQPGGYRAFVPAAINRTDWRIDDPTITPLLEEAARMLGELNAYGRTVRGIDRFVVAHVAKEATMSSRIEGTATTLAEAMRSIDAIAPERRDDWREVDNYVRALRGAVDRLEVFPLSNRMLRDVHRQLMEGVRGETKDPGEWRRSQNWIGGASPQSAFFVPPPSDRVPELMGDLELFLHNDRILLPDLVRIAIAHVQFETIHPFLDGNGRTGRLLVPLYLIDRGVLSRPTLTLSAAIEKRRREYYDRLSLAREPGGLLSWVRFFLEVTRDAARDGVESMQATLALRERCIERIASLGLRSADARTLLDHLFAEPFITVNDVVTLTGKSYPTANGLVDDFVRLGILREEPGSKRPRVFGFWELVGVYG